MEYLDVNEENDCMIALYESEITRYSKTCLKPPVKNKTKIVFNTNYRFMQFKSIAECSKVEHSAILSTFIQLPFVIEIFVLSTFEWPFKTGFTV